jgi:hypothetical protein
MYKVYMTKNNLLKIMLSVHLLSVIGVIYSLINNSWISNYIILNKFLKIEKKISENDIIRLWIICIQCRYVVTDIMAIRLQDTSFRNKKYTIKELNKMLIRRYSGYHFLEGIICFFIFYYKERYIFSLICFMWSFMWSFGLFSRRIVYYLT